MVKLNLNFYDIFRAPRCALSIQRMWIQLVGMTVGYILYLIFSYASFMSSGSGIASTWAKYGLLPCIFNADLAVVHWHSWILYCIGALCLIFAFLITNTAVARATYMISKGNNFYTWREAFSFAYRKSLSIILTPLSLVILVGFIAVGGLFIGLIANLIPFVGEIGLTLFTVFWFLAALFLLFLVIIIAASLILVPSIIATTDEDAFEAVFQTFSIIWNQPWRFVFYEVIAIALTVMSMGILAYIFKKAVFIMNAIFMAGMGSDFTNLANNGQALLQSWLLMGQSIVEGIFKNFTPLVYFQREFMLIPSDELGVSIALSSYLYAFGLLFLLGWVLSYGLSTFTTANTFIYMLLRKHKDNENLLDRKDKEEEQDEEEVVKNESETKPDSNPVSKSVRTRKKK